MYEDGEVNYAWPPQEWVRGGGNDIYIYIYPKMWQFEAYGQFVLVSNNIKF